MCDFMCIFVDFMCCFVVINDVMIITPHCERRSSSWFLLSFY